MNSADIKGVDYTSSMLERAKEKALQAGLKIDFIEADIRELNLGEKFDLILFLSILFIICIKMKICLRR